jgi:hypothetical protein
MSRLKESLIGRVKRFSLGLITALVAASFKLNRADSVIVMRKIMEAVCSNSFRRKQFSSHSPTYPHV